MFLNETLRNYALKKNLSFKHDLNDNWVWYASYSGRNTAGYAFHYFENWSESIAKVSLKYYDYKGCKFLFKYNPKK